MSLTFKQCGLNKKNNFLQAPKCECGCGGTASLILKSTRDVCNFIGQMLCEHDCNHCAIFALRQDGKMNFGVKFGEDDIQRYRCNDTNSKKVIADMQKEYQFHCYGLLEQVGEDLYDIVMD